MIRRPTGFRAIVAALLLGAAAAAPAQPDAADDDTLADAAATPMRWRLTVQAPGDLQTLLARHLDLARYADTADAAISRGELARLVAATPAQAHELLRTEGYFNARITATLAPGNDNPEVRVQVEPGPRVTIQSVQIELSGALARAQDQQQPDALSLAERLRQDFGLGVDKPYTQAAWSSAKNTVLAQLRAEGYTLATLSGTSAQIDAEANQAQLFLFVDSGPRLIIQGTRLEGLRHVDAPAVTALLTYRDGQPLREQSLQETQDRLVKTNLFDTVAVTVAPEVFSQGDSAQGSAPIDTRADQLAVPVVVKLRERAMQQATVGVGVSDTTGPRVTLEHVHQNPFGVDWQSKTKLQLASQSRQASVDLLSYPLHDGRRNLISGALARTEEASLVVQSQSLRVGRTHDTTRQERLIYLQWERDRTRNASTGAAVDDTSALSLNHHWVWRDLDNVILPTRGYSISAEVGGGRSYHSDEDSGLFGRAHGRLTGYWPLMAGFFGQARIEGGQILAPNRVAVPYTSLFRVGGDDTVRGYDYKSLGPTDAAGNATGGRVMAAASVELARPISSKLPGVWWAAFADTGNAANNWQEFDPAIGYGVGLRWRSPVGPLRIDLAYGEKVRRARLHFSVGITF